MFTTLSMAHALWFVCKSCIKKCTVAASAMEIKEMHHRPNGDFESGHIMRSRLPTMVNRHVCSQYTQVLTPTSQVDTYSKPVFKPYRKPCAENRICNGYSVSVSERARSRAVCGGGGGEWWEGGGPIQPRC
uniref:Uncharacterized protein n=1 Tax=Timema cristinae TaxID=61476 RepID=A0A7R9CLW5_TIMCR|nr:unnamed protein product [Timema cristinae]